MDDIQLTNVKEIKISNFNGYTCTMDLKGELNNGDLLEFHIPVCEMSNPIREDIISHTIKLDKHKYFCNEEESIDINIPTLIKALPCKNGHLIEIDKSVLMDINKYDSVYLSKNENNNYNISFEKNNGDTLEFLDVTIEEKLVIKPHISDDIMATKTEYLKEYKGE